MKGPPVWLDLDQAELDAAYDQSRYAPNAQQIIQRCATNSDGMRARIGVPRRFSYGAAPGEGLDAYLTNSPNAPIHIFLHGGAWRGGLARDYAFPAEMFVRAGANFVVPDFAWVQETGGNLAPIAEQVRRAVAWVYRNAEDMGGDPNRIYLSGHSSGAHLAGVVLTTDWPQQFNLPADLVKGGLCCSGIFDLTPVALSARSAYVKFNDEIVQALSPQRQLGHLNMPVTVAYGTLETPEFQRQSHDFCSAMQTTGKRAKLLVADGYNHFEIVETFANPYGLMGREALTQMGLGLA